MCEYKKGRLITDKFWYRYIYPKNLYLFDNQKIVSPEISIKGNYSFDKNGHFYSTTKIYGYIKRKDVSESYLFLLGLLNSSLFWFFIKNTGYVLRGGYYAFKTNYISPFPIPSSIDPVMMKNIERMVSEIFKLKQLSPTNDTSKIEADIDGIIFKLYRLTSEEIKCIISS